MYFPYFPENIFPLAYQPDAFAMIFDLESKVVVDPESKHLKPDTYVNTHPAVIAESIS